MFENRLVFLYFCLELYFTTSPRWSIDVWILNNLCAICQIFCKFQHLSWQWLSYGLTERKHDVCMTYPLSLLLVYG